MADDETPVVADAAPVADPHCTPGQAEAVAEVVALRDWCTLQSRQSREVELLGAFYREEFACLNHFDTATAYGERYAALRVRPA